MNDNDKRIYYTMGEVCEMFDLQPSTIRHWERQFTLINPSRNAKGNRLFDKSSLEALRLVYHLIKERGMTLEGAKKSIKGGDLNSLNRDAELHERLMKIRTALVEVREELKGNRNELFEIEPLDEGELKDGAEIEKDVVVQRFDQNGEPIKESTPAKRSRRGRRRKGDTDKSRELFAYFEQQLF